MRQAVPEVAALVGIGLAVLVVVAGVEPAEGRTLERPGVDQIVVARQIVEY